MSVDIRGHPFDMNFLHLQWMVLGDLGLPLTSFPGHRLSPANISKMKAAQKSKANVKLEAEVLRVKENGVSRVPSPSLRLFSPQTQGGLLLAWLFSCTIPSSLPPRGSVFTQHSTDSFKTNVLIRWLPREPAPLQWCRPEQAPARLQAGAFLLWVLSRRQRKVALSAFLQTRKNACLALPFLLTSPHPRNQSCFSKRLAVHVVMWYGIYCAAVLSGEGGVMVSVTIWDRDTSM